MGAVASIASWPHLSNFGVSCLYEQLIDPLDMATGRRVVTEKCTLRRFPATMETMEGTLTQELGDRSELTSRVLSELTALRSRPGQLSIQKFLAFETLRLVCGGNDLLDAFMMFEREMRRFEAGSRNEAAAALSICAKADSVLDRLQLTAEALSDAEIKDQRSARRWSDDGLKTIAAELVYLADVQGRLGSELLGIEVTGRVDLGLTIVIDQMTTASLRSRAPLIRLWAYGFDDEPEERELVVDLEHHPNTAANRGTYTMKRHRVSLPLPQLPDVTDELKLLSVSIEGRDAPMRTVTIENHASLPPGYDVRFAIYRTIATIDLLAIEHSIVAAPKPG